MTKENIPAAASWHEDHEHYAAVGQLTIFYTKVELTIKSILFNLLNIEEAEFNVLLEFGRIKPSDMPTIIKNLVAIRDNANYERKQMLIDALKKFENLSQSRNQLVHWLWVGGGVEPTLLNLKPKTKPASSVFRKSISLSEIREISAELMAT
jgi:hypothetical protein